MKRTVIAALISLAAVVVSLTALAEPPLGTTIIHAQPLNSGQIDPKLFGNFIELLDDVAPGMWAEMLNDRSFEGVTKLAGWVYYDGSPDFCDREWDTNSSWSYDTENPFNGKRSARLNSSRTQPASLTQSGLTVKKGMSYTCSGYFRTENPKLAMTVLLKTQLPNGDWMTLGSARLPTISKQWQQIFRPVEVQRSDGPRGI